MLCVIVGYQAYPLNGGGQYTFFAPMFESTDSTKKFDIQNIRLEGSSGDGMDFIQVITPEATLGDTYYWMTTKGADWLEKDGWYAFDQETYLCEENGNKVELTLGQGFYITVQGQSVKVITSGGVRLSELKYPLNGGGNYTIVGNATPVDLDIQQIKLEGSSGDGMDFIQVITPEATLGDTYYWMTTEGADWLEKDGWYAFDQETYLCEENDNKVEWKAGEGFYITVNNNNVKLVLPPPASTTVK